MPDIADCQAILPHVTITKNARIAATMTAAYARMCVFSTLRSNMERKCIDCATRQIVDSSDTRAGEHIAARCKPARSETENQSSCSFHGFRVGIERAAEPGERIAVDDAHDVDSRPGRASNEFGHSGIRAQT